MELVMVIVGSGGYSGDYEYYNDGVLSGVGWRCWWTPTMV